MEKYLRKLQHMRHESRAHYRDEGPGGSDMSRQVKKFKKVIIIAVLVVLAFIIGFIVLVVMALSWLFNRGGEEARQAGTAIVEQVTPDAPTIPSVPTLNLDSYVTGNQVDVAQLEDTFNDLPSALQDAWLNQFKAQLDDLRQQAGVSDETITSLNALYNSFQQLAGN